MPRACLLAALLSVLASAPVNADPEADRLAFLQLHQRQFPGLARDDLGDGVYAIAPQLRRQWREINDFPPYEFDLDEGEQLFHAAFANGGTYADCFAHGGIGIRQEYPRYDAEKNRVLTLELALNECRQANGEAPLPWKQGDLARISAWMASTSRGRRMHIVIPERPEARAAYERGREFFYSKRGQLNFSCADCHVTAMGRQMGDVVLAPVIGAVSHFPVYNLRWGSLGTLHRRFAGCMYVARAKPLPAQSQPLRELEYFLSYMANGMPVKGPSAYH